MQKWEYGVLNECVLVVDKEKWTSAQVHFEAIFNGICIIKGAPFENGANVSPFIERRKEAEMECLLCALNKLGKESWELIQTPVKIRQYSEGVYGDIKYLFKRLLDD